MPPRARASEAGYSLLELIVVMTIMALVVGIGGAQLFTSIEAARFNATAEDAVSRIRMLRARAYLDGVPVSLGEEPEPGATHLTIDVPDGWRFESSPIVVSAVGACTEGEVRIVSPEGRRRAYRIHAPDCRATRIPYPA